MNKKKFDDIFAQDSLGLLEVEENKSVKSRTPKEQRLINSFEEINNFYEEYDREPLLGGAINEFMLASRLQGIKDDPKKVKELLPFDFYDLLKHEESKSITVEDILVDDPLNLLDVEETDDNIYTLKYVKKTDRIRPDYISRRNICKNFSEYEAMFKTVHENLKNGTRKLTVFKEKDLIPGRFFVLRGVLLYLEQAENNEQMLNYDSGTRIRKDGRTRIIFDNGTESDMLYRSLYKALLKDGFGVSEFESEVVEEKEISELDVQNGYIYVLSSMSMDKEIRNLENLYKVGYCSGDVTARIRNASNEPTYLMNDVKIELIVRCFNLNVKELETTIHRFFREVNVEFEVHDSEGKIYYPREWFIAPLPVIEESIQLIVDEKSKEYKYNSDLQMLVKR